MTRTQPAGLTRTGIAEVAVKLAFENGVWGVTMRSVGRALGVEAMSLYHHLDGGKADLLLAMVEHLCGYEVAQTVAYRDGMGEAMRDLLLAQRYTLVAATIADTDSP